MEYHIKHIHCTLSISKVFKSERKRTLNLKKKNGVIPTKVVIQLTYDFSIFEEKQNQSADESLMREIQP